MLRGEVTQLTQLNVDNASSNADSVWVKHDISDIKLMLDNLLSQEKLEKKSRRGFLRRNCYKQVINK